VGETTRREVFETNSSSTHCLAISHSDLLQIPAQTVSGELRIYRQEFGWEVADYTSSTIKIAYIAEYAISEYPDARTSRGELFIETINRIVKDVTGATTVTYDGEGYIDHQSVEKQQYHYLFEDEPLLRRFLFNPESVLHTDNDNH